MWTARVRRRALTTLPPDKLLPDRQPAYVASWVYVFGVASLAALGIVHRERLRHRAWRARLVAHQPGRALLQQRAPVERGAVHGAAGHPPVGQVLDGRLARPPGADLDHRRGRLPGLDRGVLHRVPVPAELRLPVDRHQRQGRVQRGRGRRVLQPDELRPDADVAHRAAPDPPGRAGRRARPARPHARRQPPAARQRAPRAGRQGRPPGRPTGRRGAGRPGATTSSRKAPSRPW